MMGVLRPCKTSRAVSTKKREFAKAEFSIIFQIIIIKKPKLSILGKMLYFIHS